MKNKTYHKKKILVVFTCAFLILTGLIGRLVYLMVFDAEYYQKRAEDLHKRERKIKAARGEIVDRNGSGRGEKASGEGLFHGKSKNQRGKRSGR